MEIALQHVKKIITHSSSFWYPLQVTPPPVPILLNADYATLEITIEIDSNGKDNYGKYLCTATNDVGTRAFEIEIEDSEYAMRRTTELMVIVGVASKKLPEKERISCRLLIIIDYHLSSSIIFYHPSPVIHHQSSSSSSPSTSSPSSSSPDCSLE